MNRWQTLKQISYGLKGIVWPDAPGGLVLCDAFVTSRPLEDYYLAKNPPFAAVRAIKVLDDKAQPGHAFEARFEITVVCQNVGDRYGTGAVVGANRLSQGQSQGRGLEEIFEEVQKYFTQGAQTPAVDSLKGFQGYVESIGEIQVIGTVPSVVARSLVFLTLNVNVARFYHPVFKVKGSAPGGGVMNLAWAPPPPRYDLLRFKVYRSVAGGAVPSSPTGADGSIAVPLTGDPNLGAGASVSGLVAGVYQVTWWVAYDETNPTPSAEQRYSLPVSLNGGLTVT